MTALVSPKALEAARELLMSLLVGAKKARSVPRNEQALALAVETIHRAAEALFSATGGFSLQFSGDSASLNGVEIMFESPVSTAVIREALEARGVSSIGMKAPPNRRAIEKLVSIFEGGAPLRDSGDLRTSGPSVPASPAATPVRAAPRTASDPGKMRVEAHVDPRAKARAKLEASPETWGEPSLTGERRVLAVEAYAMLYLAVREQMERIAWERENPGSELGPPRLHPVRIIDELLSLLKDCTVDLLRLAATPARSPGPEVHAANTCVLAVGMGYAIGLGRRDLLDLGMAALFSSVGLAAGSNTIRAEDTHASIARFAGESDGSRSSNLRVAIVAEYSAARREGARKPHLFSRITAVASAYERLVSGFAIGAGERVHPLEALKRLERRFDPRIVDLLQMMLRAWPPGTSVLLDSGDRAIVKRAGARWDRPIVESTTYAGQSVDLLVEENGKFANTISGSFLFHGMSSGDEAKRLGETPSGRIVVGAPQAPPPPRADLTGDLTEGMVTIPKTPTNPRALEHKPLKARETIAAKEAVSKVRLPWVEQRAKAREQQTRDPSEDED